MSAPVAAEGFWTYFNVADELSDPITTLDDLDKRFVKQARTAATALGLSWPPHLAEAEEFALNHPEFVSGKAGW